MTNPKVILKKWRARIERARKRGRFTANDISSSYDWAKCVVGERDCICEKIIANKVNVFKSKGDLVRDKMFPKVVDLGGDFHSRVYLGNFDGALEILEKIEKIPKTRFYR